MKSLINTLDFSVKEQDELLALANRMAASPKDYNELLKGRIMASLFFEPSTRTRLSFESAMLRLGGRVIGFSDGSLSSTAKGESLSDTIRMVSHYADCIVIRHSKEGAAQVAQTHASVPVINAGDGGREHPTQTLTDLMTILKVKNRLDNLTVGCVGDLKFGRTVHSLVKNIGRYPGVRFLFVSPGELRIPAFLRTYLDELRIPYEESSHMEAALGLMDVLYMTRVQRERFFNEEEYIRLKDMFILNSQKLENAGKELAILHPLPRVNEIAYDVDDDPRAVYFDQAGYGVFARMALLAWLLDGKELG
ncbi:MAG: aspartate carbamoyltransferase [Oscillospiraceae bacterium]|nr:aspartate carbamoyltransferase [Oscillospiraceae bacterium]